MSTMYLVTVKLSGCDGDYQTKAAVLDQPELEKPGVVLAKFPELLESVEEYEEGAPIFQYC